MSDTEDAAATASENLRHVCRTALEDLRNGYVSDSAKFVVDHFDTLTAVAEFADSGSL